MLKNKFAFISKYTIQIIIILIIVIIILFIYTSSLQKQISLIKPQVINSEASGLGNIGEVIITDETTKEESFLVSATMPSVIFGTTGEIIEVKEDRIIIYGKGTNFADGLSRNLNIIFTQETITFTGDQTFRWLGLSGLEKLQPGMKILVDSSENIRGKTEFIAKTINIL